MDISWTNTAHALQDFMNILVCQKCKAKSTSPIGLTNCGHFFCNNCVKSITKCPICDVPTQPKEMSPDYMVSNLIKNCNIISEVINRRDICSNTTDSVNMSMDDRVSKIIHTPKKQSAIPKRNINKPNHKGETQLHTACLKKNAERVKLLLVAGANPNTKDNSGWTPLQEVVNFGYIEICEILLKGGALPDIPGHESRRPLHDAAISNRIEEAKLLLQYHGDINVYDRYGKRPIDYCQSKEMQKILTSGSVSHTSSKKTLNLDPMLDNSLVTECSKFVILASNLRSKNKKLLEFTRIKHKLEIVTTFRSSVTHVIVEANEQNVTKLTVDVLLAIIRGNWLLNSEWIALAVDLESLSDMDFEVFEVHGAPYFDIPKIARQNAEHKNPRLFNNCFFYFAIKTNTAYQIDDVYLTKNDLVKLVKEGEGRVLSREPNPENLKNESQIIPFHTANNSSHPLHKCTHYIIYAPGKNEPRIKYKMPHIKSLPITWLIECIERFTLVDPSYLELS